MQLHIKLVLRPYSEALSAWEASNRQNESHLLRGQTLQDALAWAADKSLSAQDFHFLTASLEADKQETQLNLDVIKGEMRIAVQMAYPKFNEIPSSQQTTEQNSASLEAGTRELPQNSYQPIRTINNLSIPSDFECENAKWLPDPELPQILNFKPQIDLPKPLNSTDDEFEERLLDNFLINHKLVRIYQGDITNLFTDVIVSSDDNHLTMSGGVSARIREIGGEEVYREARNLIFLCLGEVAVTNPGRLHAIKIFHAVVIDFEDRKLPTQDVIQQVVHTCLKKASRYRFGSIAFPLIGTGTGGFPVTYAWKIMLSQIINDLAHNEASVREVIIAIYKR